MKCLLEKKYLSVSYKDINIFENMEAQQGEDIY